MTTRGGVSSSPSSALPRRSTERSMAPMRSSRQLTVTSRSARSMSAPSAITARTRTAARLRSSGGTCRSSQICAATRSSCWPGLMSHAYSAWSARARARVSSFARTQPFEECHHLDRSERCIPPLVAVHAAGASIRLFERVRGEQAEADRDIEFGARRREPARRLTRHEVEVGRLTANHGAERDDRIVALRREQRARAGGKLPCAGHPHHVDVCAIAAVPLERIDCTLEQSHRHTLVEATDDDGNVPVRHVGRAHEFRHQCASRWPSFVCLAVRYSRFSDVSGARMGTRSSTCSPYPSKPTILRGLFVIG